MNKLKRFLFNKGSAFAYAIITAIFSVFPEEYFKLIKLNPNWQDTISTMVNRLGVCLIIFVICSFVYISWNNNRENVSVSWNNYTIRIECGDLYKQPKGKIVVDFDECFTTIVGDAPSEIKPNTVCGQFLQKHPINNMQELINTSGIKPAKGKSQFKDQVRYEPGTIVPNGDFLLMAFAKLDNNGRGYLNYEDYIKCLNMLWKQIDLYRGTSDVYMPVIGSHIIRFDKDLSQQELLDIIVCSYLLSSSKIKKPYKLHIVYRPQEGFSVNNIIGID